MRAPWPRSIQEDLLMTTPPVRPSRSWLPPAALVLCVLAAGAAVYGFLRPPYAGPDAVAANPPGPPPDAGPADKPAAEPAPKAEEAKEEKRERLRAPELEGGVSWLNTAGPLRLKDLRGKIVILDFWTYCCINCIHTLPDLAKLEKKYANEMVVIGVHSAKFDNEKDSDHIRKAVLRYEISHPVVNDAEMKIWRAFNVHSWPTLVLIDPEG